MNRNECQSAGSSIRKNSHSIIQSRDNSCYDGFNIEEVAYMLLSEITSGPLYTNCDIDMNTVNSLNSFKFGYTKRISVR